MCIRSSTTCVPRYLGMSGLVKYLRTAVSVDPDWRSGMWTMLMRTACHSALDLVGPYSLLNLISTSRYLGLSIFKSCAWKYMKHAVSRYMFRLQTPFMRQSIRSSGPLDPRNVPSSCVDSSRMPCHLPQAPQPYQPWRGSQKNGIGSHWAAHTMTQTLAKEAPRLIHTCLMTLLTDSSDSASLLEGYDTAICYTDPRAAVTLGRYMTKTDPPSRGQNQYIFPCIHQSPLIVYDKII